MAPARSGSSRRFAPDHQVPLAVSHGTGFCDALMPCMQIRCGRQGGQRRHVRLAGVRVRHACPISTLLLLTFSFRAPVGERFWLRCSVIHQHAAPLPSAAASRRERSVLPPLPVARLTGSGFTLQARSAAVSPVTLSAHCGWEPSARASLRGCPLLVTVVSACSAGLFLCVPAWAGAWYAASVIRSHGHGPQ